MNKARSILFLSFLLSFSAFSRDTLIIAMGGRTSCNNDHSGPKPYGIGMYPPLHTLMEKIQARGGKLAYLLSCFDSSPPPQGAVRFVTSEAPQTTSTGNATRLKAEIETLALQLEDPEVLMVGHSYGGFLAMYLAERLELPSGIATLATIDPISPKCGPLEYIMGSAYCHQAPKELDNVRIRQSSHAWLNFYQTAEGILHSSEIPEAVNHYIGLRGPHSDIASDNRTWHQIELQVLSE